MTAVLLDSVKPGSTGWIGVKRSKTVKVSGLLQGDRLAIMYLPVKGCLFVEENGSFSIPMAAQFINVEHVDVAKRVNGDSGVCVDLLKEER